jgi:hypothetical protein
MKKLISNNIGKLCLLVWCGLAVINIFLGYMEVPVFSGL